MKPFGFWRRPPRDHSEAQQAVQDAAEQLRAVRRNQPRVQRDKAWANRVVTENHLLDLFTKSLRGGRA